MVNLLPIFVELDKAVRSGDTRFSVLEETRVKDEVLGITYHLYHPNCGKPIEVTTDAGEVVIHGMQLTPDEFKVLNCVGELLRKHFADKHRELLDSMWKNPPKEEVAPQPAVNLNVTK